MDEEGQGGGGGRGGGGWCGVRLLKWVLLKYLLGR